MMLRVVVFCLFLANIFGQSPIVLVVGTRPEAIKMVPIYQELKQRNLPVVLCSTGQHAELLDSVFDLFDITPQCHFNIMKPGQNLTYITVEVLEKSQELFNELKPALIVVQGDTTSALSAALAAFYARIPVAHVEAGLRTNNLSSPFPEEVNRRILTLLADYHFAPTEEAVHTLLNEGVDPTRVFHTGNTIVDALFNIMNKIEVGELLPSPELVGILKEQQEKQHRTLLLTAHRRESFGEGLMQIFSAIKSALNRYPNLHVIYPVHPNPAIQRLLKQMDMEHLPNLSLLPPLPYHDLVYLLHHVDGIATDSGGIQEEGVSLNKPVFVLRNETDRPEGVSRGTAFLVGTKKEAILDRIAQFMDGTLFTKTPDSSIYGDGSAAERIANILEKALFATESK